MTTDVINGVPRELLEQVAIELEHDNDRYMLGRELRKRLATAQPVIDGDNLIRFDFTNGDGLPDSKMMTHDEMRQRYSELRRILATAKPAADGEREVWAVPVLDGEKKTTFYTEQLQFVPGIGVKQLGEPVRMVEARAAQPAADGELEWTEDDAAACGCNYRDAPCERCWALGWELGAPDNARAAQPQQAVAVTDEVRRLREALERAKDHLSNARHDVEVRANAGSEAARLVLAGIDHWLAQEAAHKTGEEE